MTLVEIRDSLTDGFSKCIAEGLVEKYASLILPLYELGIKKTVDLIKIKRGGVDPQLCHAVATAAVQYVLSGCMTGKCVWPATVSDLGKMAAKKGCWLLDDFAAAQKRRGEDSLDALDINDDGGFAAESRLMGQASLEVWRSQQAEDGRQSRIRAVDYAIHRIADMMPNRRDGHVVRAMYIKGAKVSVMSRCFGIAENHVYQILFKFRELCAIHLRRYMDEYFNWFDDEVFALKPFAA